MKVLPPLVLTLAASSAQAALYDAAFDFSTTTNPGTIWSYHEASTLTGARTLLTPHTVQQSIDFWGFRTDVEKNNTGTARSFDGRVAMDPGQLTLHPGASGQYSVLRFVNPAASTYTLTSILRACDTSDCGGIDVHLLRNGVSFFDRDLTFQSSVSDVRSVTLAQGDVLEVAVGYGVDRYYSGDSVATTFRLQTVPEPAPLAALALGVLGIARRRRATP